MQSLYWPRSINISLFFCLGPINSSVNESWAQREIEKMYWIWNVIPNKYVMDHGASWLILLYHCAEQNLKHMYHLFGGETVENNMKQKQIGDKQRVLVQTNLYALNVNLWQPCEAVWVIYEEIEWESWYLCWRNSWREKSTNDWVGLGWGGLRAVDQRYFPWPPTISLRTAASHQEEWSLICCGSHLSFMLMCETLTQWEMEKVDPW